MANVLIVDDEEGDRLLEKTILEGAGHQVFFAGDGEVALSVYKKNPIDVVVTDLKMPKLNGLRLIKEIREIDVNAVVVAISGASADQLEMAKDLGAVSTLYKPIDAKTLLAAVEGAAKTRKADGDGWGARF
jgi:DNA-binding NtrC family response regulator